MAKMHTPIPIMKLNDGSGLPMLGFGCGTKWYKAEGKEDQLDRSLIENIKKAIGMGYVYIDTAETYGTEKEVGIALKESGVERQNIYVLAKVLQNVRDLPNAIDKTLKALGLDYVDAYLIHTPFWTDSDEELQKAWSEMEKIKEAGKAKSIGVSNFLPKHLDVLKQTQKIAPSMNQIEFHPYLQQTEIVDYHKANGIATGAFAPLTPVARITPGPIDEFLGILSKKYAVTTGEIALRYGIDQDMAVVTTSSDEQRMSDMLRVTKFKLTPPEIQKLSEIGLQKRHRGFWPKQFAAAGYE